MPQGIRTGIEPLRQEVRLSGPALCQLLCGPAEEPTQASTTRYVRSPGRASFLSTYQPRALHLTSIAPRAARACLVTVSSTFFLVLPTGSELCPRAGILESRRNNQRPRKPVFRLPRVHGPRTNCGKGQAVLRGTSLDYGSWSKRAYSNLGSRSLWLGHSVLPLPCENRWLSMGFCRDIIFLQFEHTDGIYGSQYRRLSYYHSTAAGRNDWESFSPGSTELSLQPHRSAIA